MQPKFDTWFMREWRTLWPEGGKLSLSRLAVLAGYNLTHLSQVERGIRNPTRQMLEDVAAALNLPYDYILGGGAGWFWFPVPDQLKGKGKVKGVKNNGN